jgi:hypothetical protein
MENQEQEKIEENFKELLSEVSKIGEAIEEVVVPEEDESEEDGEISENDNPTITVPTVSATPIVKFVPTDENLEEYVYNSATTLINSSLFTLEKVKRTVSSVVDHRELTALAELIKATTSSIDVLNKVVMENKKLRHSKEIKEMDIAAKKELGNTKIKNQTNILVASREDVLKQLVDKTLDASKIIDISSDDFTVENDK